MQPRCNWLLLRAPTFAILGTGHTESWASVQEGVKSEGGARCKCPLRQLLGQAYEKVDKSMTRTRTCGVCHGLATTLTGPVASQHTNLGEAHALWGPRPVRSSFRGDAPRCRHTVISESCPNMAGAAADRPVLPLILRRLIILWSTS